MLYCSSLSCVSGMYPKYAFGLAVVGCSLNSPQCDTPAIFVLFISKAAMISGKAASQSIGLSKNKNVY